MVKNIWNTICSLNSTQKNTNMRILYLTIITLIYSTVSIGQGIKLNSVTKNLKNGSIENSEVYLKDDKVVMKDKKFTVLFDASKETFTNIDHKKQEYMVLTKQELITIKQQMQQMMTMMQSQIQNMPEEQKAMIEKTMKGFGNNSEPLDYDFKKTGSDQVKNWTTTSYEITESGVTTSKVEIASFEEIGVDKNDFNGMKKLISFFNEYFADMAKNMSSSQSIGFFGFSTEESPIFNSGVPVKIEYIENGNPTIESIVQEISDEGISSEIFEIPSGYRKTSLDQMIQGSFMGR
jgi:hypothetical protein